MLRGPQGIWTRKGPQTLGRERGDGLGASSAPPLGVALLWTWVSRVGRTNMARRLHAASCCVWCDAQAVPDLSPHLLLKGALLSAALSCS